MSSNVGLSTPRGSGTSGYVQRNLSLLKPRSTGFGAPYSLDPSARSPLKQRKPDQEILNHDRLREVEVQILELRDKLEDEEDVDEDEIEKRCEELRGRLVREIEDEKNGKKSAGSGKGKGKGRGIKGYQVHELAEAKAVESEKLRRALGLKGGRGGGGDGEKVGDEEEEHPMARQERRKKERDMERVKREVERGEGDGER